MGVEIKESGVTAQEFAEMEQFVYDYLSASVQSEDDGGRMRWYPWHSAEYRFNHIKNVVDLSRVIANHEGADIDVVSVAALFHDISKLEAPQDIHAEAGADVARQYLTTRCEFPHSFVEEVCAAIEAHSHQGPLDELPLETRCLIEADILDKIGANGTALMLLRMGYESRTHMDAARMVDRVFQRGKDHVDRLESEKAESLAHQRLKRVKWFREWLEMEVAEMDRERDIPGPD